MHAHQPAGNFEEVLNDAHARCYKPFIETVYRYPDFKLSVHFSGWLLGYLLNHFPKDMAKLREMVARGQVEMFGGGDTEPVLASIPERDRRSQLIALSDRLEAAFGQRPSGAWLTERVWESAVGPSLADSGIRYVTVDDYHFLCAGKHSEELTGYFSTEEDGIRLDLFPISEALRYRIPFSTAPEAVQYLESRATEDGAAAAIYFDDIEKLGIWPETYQWVYEKEWLKQFIEGVLASPLIEPTLYRDFEKQQRTRGVVYLPATSYIEMNEWTLDADRADAFAALVKQEKEQNRYEQQQALPARRHLAQLHLALRRVELDAQAHAAGFRPRCRAGQKGQAAHARAAAPGAGERRVLARPVRRNLSAAPAPLGVECDRRTRGAARQGISRARNRRSIWTSTVVTKFS